MSSSVREQMNNACQDEKERKRKVGRERGNRGKEEGRKNKI